MESNEIDEMFTLGETVFLEGLTKLRECKEQNGNFIFRRSELIIKKRLAVVDMTHGLELILKAALKRRGYSIYKLRNGLFKEDQTVAEIANPDRTIDFEDVVAFFRKEYRSSIINFNSIDSLKNLRNQIVHRGTRIDRKKREYFIGAIDCLVALYAKETINHYKFISKIQQAKDQI